MSELPDVQDVKASALVPPVSEMSNDGCSAMNAAATGPMDRLVAVHPDCTMTLSGGGGDHVSITFPSSTSRAAPDGVPGSPMAVVIAPKHSRAVSTAAVIQRVIPRFPPLGIT